MKFIKPALCSAAIASPCLAQHVLPVFAPGEQTETVHVCWPIDQTGTLTGTTVTMPIEPGVLEYREQRALAAMVGDNRLDLVFVGDGYTSAQLGQYTADVTNVVANFFQYEPFIAYRPYFRITQVDVVSLQSGVDNDPKGTFRNTALDMSYWCSNIERLLCVNVSKAYSAATSAGVADIDQMIALANSTKYGGAGYASSNLGTAAGRNSSAVQIAIHELGHSMGKLADEYSSGGPTTYTGDEPKGANSSTFTAAEQVSLTRKWYRWVGASGDPRFDDPISSYEGSSYSMFGIYRPSSNSMMRSLGRQFNQPSAEALLKAIYREVAPIDDAASAGTYTDGDTLWVTPMQPVGHSLDIRWTIDGTPDAGLNDQASVDIDTLGLSQGAHTVTVVVVDPTDIMRNESFRANRMTDSRTWSLDLACQDLADINGDGFVDNGDIGLYVKNYLAGLPSADLNGDGLLDLGDITTFVTAFLNPC